LSTREISRAAARWDQDEVGEHDRGAHGGVVSAGGVDDDAVVACAEAMELG